jgi:hypothetical protein
LTNTSPSTKRPTIVKQDQPVHITNELYKKMRSSEDAMNSLAAQSDARLALYESEIRANALMHDRCDWLLSNLAKATLRGDVALNRANRAESDLESSRSAHRDCRTALKTALEAANAPDCKSCNGTGDGIRFGNGSVGDETPPELVDPSGCEDCDGLGLEWI